MGDTVYLFLDTVTRTVLQFLREEKALAGSVAQSTAMKKKVVSKSVKQPIERTKDPVRRKFLVSTGLPIPKKS
jgi:hypothetical protein